MESKFKTKNYRDAISVLIRKYNVTYDVSSRRFKGVTRDLCIDMKHELESCGIETYKDCKLSSSILGIKETFDWLGLELASTSKANSKESGDSIEQYWKNKIDNMDIPYQEDKTIRYVEPIPYVFMSIVKNFRGE